ncbi:protein cornichon homolog 4 [Phlebotomus argentipes]|uniref:protein cornichon homolog 4 n=1 Tax=Phlebotomus argentipes TaxID=94469 RepID=UPI002892DACF|nr:protein cornichon homolog 4 [Phlebotomus argentipes]
MIPETLLFAFALFDTGFVLFVLVYYVIILSDLECDYLNAQQCCSKLNFWVLPRAGAHVFLVIFLIINGHWWLVFFNFPLVTWIIYEIARIPSGNMGIYDPTEIHNRGMVQKHLRDCMINLVFYLMAFFIYLYCMIMAMLKGDPIRRHEDGDIVTEF